MRRVNSELFGDCLNLAWFNHGFSLHYTRDLGYKHDLEAKRSFPRNPTKSQIVSSVSVSRFPLCLHSVPPQFSLFSSSIFTLFRVSFPSVPPRFCSVAPRFPLYAAALPLCALRSSLSILYSVVSALHAPLSALHAPVPTAVWHGARHLPSNGAAERRSGRSKEQVNLRKMLRREQNDVLWGSGKQS